jgi:HYR domain
MALIWEEFALANYRSLLTVPVFVGVTAILGLGIVLRAAPSANGTRVPRDAAQITDSGNHVWTLVTNSQCPSGYKEVRRDGARPVPAYASCGSTILFFNGAIYAVGDDDWWYAWYEAGVTWIFLGATAPDGGSQPPQQPPPPGAPTISCPANRTATASSSAGVTVTYPAPTVSGGTPPTTVVTQPVSGSVFPVGNTTVTATVTDAAGRKASCSFVVTVTTSMTPVPPPVSGSDSAAYGLWTPSSYDTCTKAQHDSYNVIGPDGKRYPTWHPPLGPGGCSFGHEHGRDPRQSSLWPQIQQHFYYDANRNGVMDSQEAAVTGIPFGYANEQLDVYSEARGQHVMRHEDHVGHKVDWADNESDIATDKHGSMTDGVHVQRNSPFLDTGVRCGFLAKVHQGVSSADAFTNNLHEVMYFANCTHSNASLNQQISIVKMMAFNRPGGFTKFMPMCGIERRSSPQDFVNLGTNSMNEDYPSGPGDREIITRDCIEQRFLVPQGSFSGNLYEAWPASLAIYDANGRAIVSGINLLFDVEDANRYFYPEALKAQNGYTISPQPSFSTTNLGMTMDLCYEQIAGGRKARGGACDFATNYGQTLGIKWDDPRSAFKGLHRGMYFMPAILKNAGGPNAWYTDPYGEQGSANPFPGSIKQRVTPGTMDYSSLIGQSLDPRVTDRIHNGGSGTVHAPN